jgi:hypothetical protein
MDLGVATASYPVLDLAKPGLARSTVIEPRLTRAQLLRARAHHVHGSGT